MKFKTPLLKAVYDVLTSQPEFAGRLPGGLSHGRPDANPTMPYGYYEVLSDVGIDAEDTGTGVLETLAIAFHAYAVSSENFGGDQLADEALEWIRDVFVNEQPLMTWTGGAVTRTQKTGGDLSEDPDRLEDGNVVWHAILVLEFTVTLEET